MDQIFWNYVLSLSSALPSLKQQGLLAPDSIAWISGAFSLTGRLHPDPDLEWRENQVILGGILSVVTHYQDSSMCYWEGMDPLHLNKASSQGGMMDHVFKSQWHKRNLKETVIRLLFFFHLGNCLTTIGIAHISSLMSIEFDTCVVTPCGDIET
jgi:hypothetical protein